MKLSKGIPEDSPENSVAAIKDILEEEAAKIGASFECTTEEKGTSIEVTIDIGLKSTSKSFRAILAYVPSENLSPLTIPIGNGLLSPQWELELLPRDDINSPTDPPFRWALYPAGTTDRLRTKPTAFLDGRLLRKLLYKTLGVGDKPL